MHGGDSAAVRRKNTKEEVQGVFVIHDKKGRSFVPVDTGISGTTDIEVTERLTRRGRDRYGQLQSPRTLKPGTSVKIDNSTAQKEETQVVLSNRLCNE